MKNPPGYAKARYAKRRAAGLCHHCSTPAVKDSVLCRYHHVKHRCVSNIRQWAKKAKGICLQCPTPAEPGKVLCHRCRDKKRISNRNAQRRRRGIPLDAPHYRIQKVILKCNPWLEE